CQGESIDDSPMGVFQQRQERAHHSEHAKAIDVQMLLDDVGTAEIFKESYPSIVDQHIKGVDFLSSLLDLRKVRHVKLQRYHAFISVFKCTSACSCIDPLCSPSQRFIHKRPTETAARACDQDGLVRTIHLVIHLLSALNGYDAISCLASLICS